MADLFLPSRLRKCQPVERDLELTMFIGSNHSRKLLPNHPVNWRSWPSSREALRHCNNLSCILSHLVGDIPYLQIPLRSLPPVRHLRSCIPVPWPGAIRL